MKVNNILDHIDSNFICKYLYACGIDKPTYYLHPDEQAFDSPLDYVNMKEAIMLLRQHIESKSRVCIVID